MYGGSKKRLRCKQTHARKSYSFWFTYGGKSNTEMCRL
jgi:hypothetical protein